MVTVKDMYSVTSHSHIPLLSDYSAEWWDDYITNFAEYDNVFRTIYNSFSLFSQDEEDTQSTVTSSFISLVRGWLRMNDRRYHQLWLSNVVNYNVDENYRMNRTTNSANQGQSAVTEGQRTDIDNTQIGEQYTDVVNNVSPWNNSNEQLHDSSKGGTGSRNDINTFTKGQETDTKQYVNSGESIESAHGLTGGIKPSDLLKGHTEYWRSYNFYMIVFKDIADQFLII